MSLKIFLIVPSAARRAASALSRSARAVSVPFADFIETIESELTTRQTRLLTTARAMNQANYHTNINTLDELVEHIETKRAAGELPGWVLAGWDGTEESEAKIKELTGFTTRNIPFTGQFEEKTTCIVTGQPAK